MADEPNRGGGDGANLLATVQAMLSRENAERKVLKLLRDNHKQRDELRDARTKIADLEKVKPADDSVVLTAEQAKDWEAYTKLGKPTDVEAKVQKSGELEGKLAQRDREKVAREAAAELGWKPDVLLKLPGAADATFELREEKDAKNNVVKVPYVTPAGEKEKPVKLFDHAEAVWPEFLPSLKADAARGGNGGTPFPGQAPHGTPPKSGPLGEEELRERKLATSRGRYAAL